MIGEVDFFSAPTLVHQDAIYIHQGRQYYVEELLWDDRQARVRRINVDYYTDAQDKVDISVLEEEERRERGGLPVRRGELMLRVKAVMFKKIKLETHENLGWGDIHTPEIEMHTQGGWLLFPADHPVRKDIPERELGASLAGTAHALGTVAPLFVLCDPRDIRFRSEVRAPTFELPAVYFYDSFPGGIELSYKVLENLQGIAASARTHVQDCPCENGCPSCVGVPDLEVDVKARAARILSVLADSD
ncbi:MAG: DUF1998 domain-containing protein [Spirochaetia bacterium]|nr:DUF1998 domain-containing protein [Spirochaetia bacterium]